jgi:hypothetical protein
MEMQDVLVRAQSIISGSWTVRADERAGHVGAPVVPVPHARGDEVHHWVGPCGSGAEPLTEKDGTALAGGLLSVAETAAVPGSHLLVLHGTGLQWCRSAMDSTSGEPV